LEDVSKLLGHKSIKTTEKHYGAWVPGRQDRLDAVSYTHLDVYKRQVHERGKASGIVFGGVGFGSGIAPPLLTSIILLSGWHAAFWFCALIGVVAAAVWYVVARDTPEQHSWVSARELALISSGRGDVSSPLEEESAFPLKKNPLPWAKIFFSKQVLALTGSYFTYGYISWIFFSWFYIYMAQVRGLSLKTSAVYSIFPFIAMTVGSVSYTHLLPATKSKIARDNHRSRPTTVAHRNKNATPQGCGVIPVSYTHLKAEPSREIAYMPARVLMQDFTGVPAVVDLAAMRDAIRKLGGNPERVNPLVPAELVIDHSVQVDEYGTTGAYAANSLLRCV